MPPSLDECEATDVRILMLTRLGNLSGYMTALAESMKILGVFDEWAEDLMKEVKKTDELVQIWSSL